ncbi:MAG: hypothetical protein P8X88_02505 [Gammaproteobacteria bacterium]
MLKTLVLQSHRQPLVLEWIRRCVDSVKSWSVLNKYEYMCIGDELFDYVSDEVLDKTKNQKVIATDLARLKALQDYLHKDYERVVWCDADFLIFSPCEFNLPDKSYAVGREVWIQNANKSSNKLTAHIKVHNAFMMFNKGNSFLDFYTDTAEHLLMGNQGSMPPQFIGPKLLTAIHNIAQCPVLESAGMLSPQVIKDIANGGGPALALFTQKTSQPIAAANLCNSLFGQREYSINTVMKCIDALQAD